MRTVEETADLDSLLVMGHEAGEASRPTSARLIGTLLVAAAIAVAISGATVVLARTAFARPADVIFVTPNAPSSEPSATAADPGRTGRPSGAPQGQLDDGLFPDPSQDPASNG